MILTIYLKTCVLLLRHEIYTSENLINAYVIMMENGSWERLWHKIPQICLVVERRGEVKKRKTSIRELSYQGPNNGRKGLGADPVNILLNHSS